MRGAKNTIMRAIAKYLKSNLFSLAVCILWWFPVTIFGYWTAPVGTTAFSMLKFPLIGVGLMFIAYYPLNSINWKILIFLGLALVSTLASDAVGYSSVKLFALTIVIGVLSPFLRSATARSLRESLWRNLCQSAVLIVVLSVILTNSGFSLPVLYDRAGSPGITSHAMLFGPIAGISVIYLLSKALVEKSPFHFVLSAICYYASLTSLSRAAIVATTFGAVAVLLLSIGNPKFIKFGLIPSALIGIVISIFSGVSLEGNANDLARVEAFSNKGIETSSRDELWETRISEFKANPLLGLGIGMSNEYDRSVEGFVGSVEPGSAYLVVLSMTGIAGAIALIWIISIEIFSIQSVWKQLPQRTKYELSGIGLLLFVHGGAEGWIYSPGGLMCLFFWLWFGRLGDAVDHIRYARSRRCA